jgi:hypothetical protein
MELLKHWSQLQRRAFATVRHDRHHDVVVAVEPPLLDDDRDARNTLQPALALVAAFALTRDQLPVGAGAWSRIVLLGDEAATVERDDVERVIMETSPELSVSREHHGSAINSCKSFPRTLSIGIRLPLRRTYRTILSGTVRVTTFGSSPGHSTIRQWNSLPRRSLDQEPRHQ